MLLSTTTNIYGKRPDGRMARYSESIERVAQAGFDCIDFQFNNAILYGDNELRGEDWEAQVERLAQDLEASKLPANQAHAPFYEFLDPDLPDRELKEEMTRRSVIAAGKLGVRWIVFHPGTLFGNPRMGDNLQANQERFKPLLELAGRWGVGIALENIFDKFMYANNAKGKQGSPLALRMANARFRTARHFANWPEELAALVDSLRPYGQVGACWDTGHGNEMMVDQRESILLLGDRLKALHVNNNFGVFDDHLIPYFGNIQWDEVLSALKAVDYDGELTFETGMNFNRVPEPLIDGALAYAAKTGRYMIQRMESL